MYLGTNIGKGGILCLLEILCDHYGFQSKSVHNFSSLFGSMCEARVQGLKGRRGNSWQFTTPHPPNPTPGELGRGRHFS